MISLPDWMRDEIDLVIERQIAPRFSMNGGLEGRLLAAGKEMAAEHLPRVRRLMHDWALAALADPNSQALAMSVAHARLVNAFALWGIDSLGADHDTRLLKALESRSACFRGQDGQASELEARLFRLKSLADDDLELALRDERELLARWGNQRPWNPVLEPFPVNDEIRRLRAGIGQAEPALSPVLAFYLLATDKKLRREPDGLSPPLRCALQQWALWGALQKAGSEAERRTALSRWREALKMDAAAMVWLSAEEASKPQSPDNPYPRLAYGFNVSGQVDLVLELDEQGRLLDSRPVAYQLNVLGLPAGERPAAFEAPLAHASQQRIKELSFPPDVARPPGSRRQVQQSIFWKLER